MNSINHNIPGHDAMQTATLIKDNTILTAANYIS